MGKEAIYLRTRTPTMAYPELETISFCWVPRRLLHCPVFPMLLACIVHAWNSSSLGINVTIPCVHPTGVFGDLVLCSLVVEGRVGPTGQVG